MPAEEQNAADVERLIADAVSLMERDIAAAATSLTQAERAAAGSAPDQLPRIYYRQAQIAAMRGQLPVARRVFRCLRSG